MKLAFAIVAVLASAAVGLSLPALASGQSATATPGILPGPTPYLFPLRLVLTGPSSATEGDVVAYRLQYQAVRQFGIGESGGIVLGWSERGAAIVNLKGIGGPPPTDGGPQTDTSENIGLAGRSGVVELDVQLPKAFTGSFSAGIDIKGTGITLPSGSVVQVITDVSAASVTPVVPTSSPSVALPGTGTIGEREPTHEFRALELACGALCMGLSILGAGAVGRRHRRARRDDELS